MSEVTDVYILNGPEGRHVELEIDGEMAIPLMPESAEVLLVKLHSVVQNLRGVERPPQRSIPDRIRLIRSAVAKR